MSVWSTIKGWFAGSREPACGTACTTCTCKHEELIPDNVQHSCFDDPTAPKIAGTAPEERGDANPCKYPKF